MLYKVGARSNAGLLFTHAFSVAIRYFRVALAYIQTATKDFSNVNCLRLVKYVSIELCTSYCTEEISLSLSLSAPFTFRNSARNQTRCTLYCGVADLLEVSEPRFLGVFFCALTSIPSLR